MNKEKYIEDLAEIKDIMNRTNRFISLSGLSGISAGITAIAGAFAAYQTIFKGHDYLAFRQTVLSSEGVLDLLLIAIVTLILALCNAFYFTRRKIKKQNQTVWNIHTKKLLLNLFVPLFTGGVLCLMFLLKGFVGFLPSISLIFYGLALINASKYTLPEIWHLGFVEIILGLVSFQFIEYALLFWACGFGVIQIVYGLIIQRKY
jgi:hypothetical protein